FPECPAMTGRSQLCHRAPLLGCRMLVHDKLHRPITLVNGARPRKQDRELHSAKRRVPEMSIQNADRAQSLAAASRGQCIELAWTTPRAVAANHFIALDTPSCFNSFSHAFAPGNRLHPH